MTVDARSITVMLFTNFPDPDAHLRGSAGAEKPYIWAVRVLSTVSLSLPPSVPPLLPPSRVDAHEQPWIPTNVRILVFVDDFLVLVGPFRQAVSGVAFSLLFCLVLPANGRAVILVVCVAIAVLVIQSPPRKCNVAHVRVRNVFGPTYQCTGAIHVSGGVHRHEQGHDA